MAPTTPNPATTEWVPLWDLNGGVVSPVGPHHTTHELGGTDQIQNVAWTDQINFFTENQIITSNTPSLFLNETDQGTDSKLWKIYADNSILHIEPTLDSGLPVNTGMQLNRAGVLTVLGGLGQTPLNASLITSGTLPDARLSPNVALKNIDNHFSPQTFSVNCVIEGPNAVLYFRETAAPVNATIWRMLGYGDGLFRLESLNDALSIVQSSFYFYRDGTFQATSIIAALNASQLTTGTVPDARLSINVLKYSGGYPGGITNFLRADGAFAPPGGGITQVRGSWVPIIGGTGGESGQDYKYQSGWYLKTGQLVHLWCYTQFRGPGGGPPGHVGAKGTIIGELVLKNFPFGTAWYTAVYYAGVNAYFSNMLTPSDKVSLTLYAQSDGAKYAYIKQIIQNTNPLPLHEVDINDDTQMIWHISYLTDE